MNSLSLRGRLLLLVTLAILPAFILIIASSWENRVKAEGEARQQTRYLASQIAEEERRIFAEGHKLLSILSNIPYVTVPELLPQCRESLPRIRSENPLYANIGMVDPHGQLLCSAMPFTPPVDLSDRAWFRRAVASGGFSIGDYLVGQLTGLPSVGLAYPVYAADGRLLKVLFATIDLSFLLGKTKKYDLLPGAVIAVVDANGTILVRYPDPERKLAGKPAPEFEKLGSILDKDCRGFAEFVGQDGVLRLHALEPLMLVDGKCVYVRVGVPTESVVGPIERLFWRDMGAMLAVTLIAFAAAWFGSDWLVLRRVYAIGDATRRLGRGDLSARSGLPHTPEELGQLAQCFDEMASGIEERENRLATADQALRRTNRALTVLSAGNRIMLRATDEQFLLDAMCHMMVEKGGYRMAWVGYAMDDAERSVRQMAESGFEAGYLAAVHISWADGEHGTGPIGTAIRERRIIVNRNVLTDPQMAPWREVALKHGFVSSIALPLLHDSTNCLGALCLYSTEADAFDEDEIELLSEAAADLSFGIGRLHDQARRREAEEANRIKSEFLANMSHELRTPLNAIIGFSDVLKDGLLGPMEPNHREYVIDIYQSGCHLLSLINDILDLSKVEAGKMALDLEESQVAALLENSLSVIREKAAVHRITLREEVQTNLESICVDPRKTKQIVYNLLSNAIKFTPDGGQVNLRVRRACRGEVENWCGGRLNCMRLPLPASDFTEFLEIAIEDTGIGIKPDDAPRLFQPFSQLDSSLSRHYEGTGLGLVMVMKMAHLHGGTVAVSSTPDQGSCFTVWLPWRRADASSMPAVASANQAAVGAEERLVLVVEDDDDAAELMHLMLENEGLCVLRAASAEDALSLMASRHPALIILDIILPGMDGWDFLARCKSPESLWVDVPVVIASIVADRQRGFSLGAAQVLQKPVSREEMTTALLRLGMHPGNNPICKVLIVDDDPKAVDILAAYLAEPGYTVLRAYGGKEAIELAGRECPHLVVLDLMMPDVSGLEVIEALKGQSETEGIPIVVVTAKTLEAKERAALNTHVAAILEKAGFDHGMFIAEVRRTLAKGSVA